MADNFDSMWGTSGAASTPAPTGTTVLDPKEFEKTWLKPAAVEATKEDTNTATSTANAALGGAIEGVPIIGPPLKAGTEKISARIRSLMYGTPYEDELKAVQNYTKQSAEAHPVANTVGQVAGAVGPMVTGAGLAPEAFGIAGPLLQRTIYGAGTNALINGGDSLVRSGGDLEEAGKGAGVGAAIGGSIPVAGNALGYVGRQMLGAPTDAATNALIQRAEQLGIPLRPAQVSTSPFINKLDQMVAKIPGSGMGALVDEQHVGVNRAVARTFGEDAERITPDVMASARRRIGGEFDTVERNTTVQFDRALGQRLGTVLNHANSVLEPGQVAPLANRVTEISNLARGGTFDGETFHDMLKQGAPLSRLQKSADPNIKFYAGQIREALQDALERSASPEMAQRYNTARMQYRNMKTVQPLAEKAATGDISPLLLLNEVRKANPNFAYGAGGDIGDIARIGQRFMRQPPDSGTPLGNKVLDLFMKGGAGVAAGAGGYAAYNSESPIKDTGLGLSALLAASLASRGATTLLNRPQTVNALFARSPALVPAYNQLSPPERQ